MGQLRALVALRWQMIRERKVRRGLLLLALSLPLLVVIGGFAGQVARDSDLAGNLRLLHPSLLLGFAVLTLAAPLSNGGGSELFPQEQLVSFPVRPQTTYLGSLASAPLNLAWATQVVSLVTATSFISTQGPLALLGVVTTLAYVAFTTTAGQALGWYVVGVRQSPWGRIGTRLLGTGVLVFVAAMVLSGEGTTLLDQSPTTRVTIAEVQVSQGSFRDWAVLTALLVVATVVSLRLGGRAAAWALRQPTEDKNAVVSRRQRRHPLPGSHLRVLLRADRASVWRSTPLRRGLIVLALLPGAVAAAARVDWSSLALLPGLVAAGAGLLFGVNAFCLDGPGGIWLASLPHSGRDSIRSKALVTAETCLLAVVVAVLTGALRSAHLPTAAQTAALVSSVVATSVMVAATCLRLSVRRPHRADLRGPRDAPAPPATMAVYSLRLAVSTTTIGSLFVGAAESRVVIAGPVIGLLVLLWSTRSLRRTFRDFDVVGTRARVVSVVAAG